MHWVDPNHGFSGLWIIFNTFQNHPSEKKKLDHDARQGLIVVSHGIINKIKPAAMHTPPKNMRQK